MFEIAIERGIDIRYDHTAMRLEQDDSGRVNGVTVRTPDGRQTLKGNAVVLACGGFEANPEMRARYLGPGWELAKVRGVRYNTGDGHKMAFDVGAQAFGTTAAATPSRGTSTRPPSATAPSPTFTRSTRTRSASS